MKSIIHLGIDPATWPDGAVERVAALADGYEVLVTTDRSEIEQHLDRIEVALARFPNDLITRAPALKWVQQQGAGADWLTRYPDVRAHDFTLTNASGVHAVPISEHMLGFLLAIGRGFPACIRGQRERAWDANRNQDLFELEGKRVLILGVGAIGERFAVLCRACGMETVGVRRDPSIAAEGVDRMVAPEALLTELAQADVVANTLPYTEETHHLLGVEAFDALKQGAIVVNIGRGGTIDEAALVGALERGTVRAAGLDVFETEPLPGDSPLWDMENVLITPHYAGLTPRYNERLFDIFMDNLGRYLRGEALRNVVDKSLGY